MKPILSFFVISLTLGLFVPLAHAEQYDVFILAGQSNMDGRAQVKDLTGVNAKWAAKQRDVLINYSNSGTRGHLVSSDGWQPLQPGYSAAPGGKGDKRSLPGHTFGPEVFFGHAMAQGLPGRHIALIKFAEGGTSLKKLWMPDQRAKLYDKLIAHVHKSLKELDQRGDTYVLRGIVWHQGESDAHLPAEEYQKLLTDFIQHLRNDLGNKDLPFVIGEVYDNGKRDQVRAAQKATAHAVPHTYFVSAQGLKTWDGGTHFDAASQIEFGKRFAAEMLKHVEHASK